MKLKQALNPKVQDTPTVKEMSQDVKHLCKGGKMEKWTKKGRK